MEFGLSRGEMLDLLANVMLVPDEGRTAFLGRFQHLQRLALVDGINPGRGKASQYRAEQVIVIAIAMQFLQLGLSPERTVRMMHRQYLDVDKSIKIALSGAPKARLNRSYIFIDPALLVRLSKPQSDNGIDGDGLFGAWDQDEYDKKIKRLTTDPATARVAIINVSTTIELVAHRLECDFIIGADFPHPGPKHEAFMKSLRGWLDSDRRQVELMSRRGNP